MIASGSSALNRDSIIKPEDLLKSRETPFFVIPAEVGIQSFQMVTGSLGSGFHRSDDFYEFINLHNSCNTLLCKIFGQE